MGRMANWNKLDLDLLIIIAEKLQFLEDFNAFSGVCTWWRRSLQLVHEPSVSRHAPWLMLPEPVSSKKHLFRGLNDRIILEADLPDIVIAPIVRRSRDWRHLFSSRGWLICISPIGFNIILLHPLLKILINPPPLPVRFNHDGRKRIMDPYFYFQLHLLY
ncbi:hypothetical protein RND81_01G122000 [Saponaria officinalis]|uniref:F-box protein n=1 Tax=Saponaria officinalis TaxID=3572 RepID=A0AAW1N789_SAPOF